PEGAAGVEVLLEPNAHPAARTYQKAMFDDGIPATSFGSADIHAEHERLAARGVVFRAPPTRQGPVVVAVFEDTCGNLSHLHQAACPAPPPSRSCARLPRPWPRCSPRGPTPRRSGGGSPPAAARSSRPPPMRAPEASTASSWSTPSADAT